MNYPLLTKGVFIALKNGDQQAWIEFSKAFYPSLYQTAFMAFDDKHIASSLADAVLDEFYKRMSLFPSENQAKVYLFMKMRDAIATQLFQDTDN